MPSLPAAAQALVQALADPHLDPVQRAALATALAAVLAPGKGSDPPPPTGRVRRAPAPRVERKADSLRFGKETVAALALPAEGEHYVYDTECPQLAVRLRPGGSTYIVQAWDRERRRSARVTLGKTDALTPEQARRQARELVADMGDGTDIRRERHDGTTVRDLVTKWHAEKARGTRTADELRDKALHYLGPLADRPAKEIEREHIGRIHTEIATKARKRVFKTVDGTVQPVEVGEPGLPATADKWRATLSAMFTWAMSKGLAAANPCEGIAAAFDTKRAARTNYLHGDALARFWAALEADADADTRDALLLLLFTGQRRGNVLEMRWADLDVTGGVWSLGAQQTKQNKAQGTPLVGASRVILERRQQSAAGPWVFPATRASADGTVGPMSETRLRDAWARICTAAGIEDLRPHDLRHTAGSWLARLGASEAIRQKALGHQTSAMAARYSHLELDPVADAMERSSIAITKAATGREK